MNFEIIKEIKHLYRYSDINDFIRYISLLEEVYRIYHTTNDLVVQMNDILRYHHLNRFQERDFAIKCFLEIDYNNIPIKINQCEQD